MATDPAAPLRLVPPPSPRQRLTSRVKALAAEHGLAVARVTHAGPFPELATVLLDRIAAGHLAGLDWFTPQRALESLDPRTVHPEPRSILSVALPYHVPDPGKPDDGVPRGRIARYARGRDYHVVMRKRMDALVDTLARELGQDVVSRRLADTARVVDRAVAARAGLGWYGKNACIIVPGHGSWVVLGEVLLDLDLEPDAPLDRDCGRCAICIDRCPTGAIVAPYTVSAPLCLSFQTIEQRGPIPRELRPLLGDWVFGCDVCQDVCPYDGAATGPADQAFAPPTIDHAYPPLAMLLEMREETFRDMWRGSPVLRAKRRGLARNAAVALGNVGGDMDVAVPALSRALAEHDEPLVRGHAAWALGRIGGASAQIALDRAFAGDPNPAVREEASAALSDMD